MNSTFTNITVNLMDERLASVTYVLLVSIQISNFLLGIPLNVYAMFLLTRTGTMDASVILSLSQCVSEILYALSAPLYVMCMPIINICSSKLLGFFVGIFMSAHPLFQCCVCLERYLAVVHPVTFLKFRPMRYRLAFSTVIWTCVIPLCFTVMLTFPAVPYTIFGSLYIIILIVELFCCVSILKVLQQPGPGEIGRVDIRKRNIKEKAYKVVFVSLMILLTQSTPVGIVVCLKKIMLDGVFYLAVTICVAVNFATRFTQVLFHIHTVGKLKFPRCV